MAIGMFWEHTPADGVWRKTKKLFVWHSGAWVEVQTCWIRNGGQWKKCFTNVDLTAAQLFNNDFFCDPTMGTFYLTWSTVGDVSTYLIKLEYSFDVGNTWTQHSLTATSAGSLYDSLDGIFGFSTLDTTQFRVTLIDGDGNVLADPRVLTPIYLC